MRSDGGGNPFEPGTYGHRFFAAIVGKSAHELHRMDRANDSALTYTADEEVARMVRSQALWAAIARAEGGGGRDERA